MGCNQSLGGVGWLNPGFDGTIGGVELDAGSLGLLLALAFLAGFVDSVVGGGGLIQVPALLVLFPGLPVPTVLGTNKLASVVGTLAATFTYLRRVPLSWRAWLPGLIVAFAASYGGARLTSYISSDSLRVVVLGLLVAMLAYTLMRKNLGQQAVAKPAALLKSWLVAVAVGFYDGFFGPGTGSLFIFGLVSMVGLSFLQASAQAKIWNVGTNLAALVYFVPNQQVAYALAIPMAVCNVLGSVLGARLALRLGSDFVRKVFVGVVSLLILRLAFNLLQG